MCCTSYEFCRDFFNCIIFAYCMFIL
uniref:Uncharacterized protein n=1 Tax=Anguilla anguilla TaxID=7936 RepID=A0A0E9TLL5_ANGAN